MIETSQQFKDAVYALTRTTDTKVVFEFVDIDAADDATIAVTNEASISRKDEVINGVRQLPARYATFENDYWKLDGTFALPPKSSENQYEVGWWSSTLSGADGTFSPSVKLTTSFGTTHDSIGITIIFDTLTNEYAKDFTVKVYDASDNLIHTEAVTNNTLAKYVLEENLPNYKKIEIEITKWVNPYRRARIVEVDYGIIQEYTGDDLISVSVLEEIDTISNTVSSNMTSFSVDNSDKRFNILNPTGIYPYLQRRQRLIPYIGVERADNVIEYIQMGIYYLTEWKSDEGTITTTIEGRDMLDILSQSIYRKGKYETRSLYDLAVDVLTDAGVTKYNIDTALQSISVTGHMPLLTHREALQEIGVAGMAAVYCDRNGYIQIKQLSNTDTGEEITADNTYAWPEITLDKLINIVEVTMSKYTAQASPSQVYAGTITINGTQDVWIQYNNVPCQSVTASVSGGTLNSASYYGNAAKLNITASGTVNITASGTILDKTDTIYQLIDGTAPLGEQALAVNIENTLISSDTIANNIANWILAESKKRFLYDIDWRQNPSLEAGDMVTVEDNFGVNKLARITKQEWNFDGGLSGKTSTKAGA